MIYPDGIMKDQKNPTMWKPIQNFNYFFENNNNLKLED